MALQFRSIGTVINGTKFWGAKAEPFQFVIFHETGIGLRKEDRSKWIGYTISWHYDHGGRTHRIERIFPTLEAAKAAAEETYERLLKEHH